MIKIIKSGKKEFTRVCSRCNCEFVYELADLDTTLVLNGVIRCPECGMELKHLDNELQLSQIPQTTPDTPACPTYPGTPYPTYPGTPYPTYPGTPNYPNGCPYYTIGCDWADSVSRNRLD